MTEGIKRKEKGERRKESPRSLCPKGIKDGDVKDGDGYLSRRTRCASGGALSQKYLFLSSLALCCPAVETGIEFDHLILVF